MIKFKVLLEGTHGRLIQGIQLLITMCFQEHCPSSARGKLIGQSGIKGTILCKRGYLEEIVS